MKSKIGNKGFGALEFVLTILIVLSVSAAGWLTYKHNHKSSNENKTTSSKTSSNSQTAVGAVPCPKQVTAKANSYNTDTSDSRVTCAFAYGQQQSKPLLIDNGSVTVVSALYAQQLGDTSWSGDAAIVNVVLKNTSSKTQNYDMNNFTLQLPDGGQRVFNTLFDSYEDSTVTLSKGGSAVETLTFVSISPNNAKAGQGELIYTPVIDNAKPVDTSIIFKTPYTYAD